LVKVYIANFGRENYEWPACKARGTVATMNEVDIQPFWVAGDKEGYIERRLLGKNAAGITPTRPVASRWYNLMSIISSTAGDIWVHRQKDELWWTKSTAAPPTFEEKVEPIARGARVVVCHKPCEPWSDRSRTGNQLDWTALHPKAKEFMFTESTLQVLSADNAEFALALLAGKDLTPWYSRADWNKKTTLKIGKGGPGTLYNAKQLAAYRMADTAMKTAALANGQQALKNVKIKDFEFHSQSDCENYILDLFDLQERVCALTGLTYFFDGENDDKARLCSLDRIDSSGHYEVGNLQVVCRFANEWKSHRDNDEFKRLIREVRSISSLDVA